MVEKGYNIVEIVDAVRRAGNPQKAALDALADTDGLTDAVLLDALGVEQWGNLPTTPYPDIPDRTQPDNSGQGAPSGQSDPAAKPRKKPGPKPGARRGKTAAVTQAAGTQKTEPKPVSVVRLADLDILREELGRTANMLDEFSYAWSGVLTDPKGPFSEEQVEAFGAFCETASVFLNGWDAARRRME